VPLTVHILNYALRPLGRLFQVCKTLWTVAIKFILAPLTAFNVILYKNVCDLSVFRVKVEIAATFFLI